MGMARVLGTEFGSTVSFFEVGEYLDGRTPLQGYSATVLSADKYLTHWLPEYLNI
jgi:hypothetical protein